MRGRNEIRLNQQTMREAIKYWLDSKMVKTNEFIVTEVKEGDGNMFIIHTDTPPDLPKTPAVEP